MIESGRYKGLTKYTWHFTTSHIVKRIFSTANVGTQIYIHLKYLIKRTLSQIELQLERAFERHPDGHHFVPYVRPATSEQPAQGQARRRLTYARLRLYMARIIFEVAPKELAGNGVLLTWTPDILPRSHFGLMHVEFVVETQSPS